jgi:ribonuclease Z
MTDHFLAAWAEDTAIRVAGLERGQPGGYRVNVQELREGVAYDSGGVRVTAIRVPHGDWETALAWRIDTPTRSVVISGDTRDSEELMRAAEGVDVLVSEVYIESRVVPERRPGGDAWPLYVRDAHISEAELARLATRARPRLLLLSHVLFMGGTEQEVLDGIRRGGYTGTVVVARDLGRY